MTQNNPSIRELRAIVESAGSEIFENEVEELLYPPTVFNREMGSHPYKIYNEYMQTKKVDDIIRSHAAAPGYGYTDHRITRMDNTGIYGVKLADTIQELEPWMVEDETIQEDREATCPKCGYRFDDGGEIDAICQSCKDKELGEVFENNPYVKNKKEKNNYCLDCDGWGMTRPVATGKMNDLRNSVICPTCKGGGRQINVEDKPYATMKDGPDKYLFRKDGKQKLVGSKDNECDYDDEELQEDLDIRVLIKENKMNKELDRLKKLAGINENQLRADLPDRIDDMLMDMAQMTYAFKDGGYNIIHDAEITPEKISELKKIYHEWKRNAGDEEGGEVIAAKAISVLKGEIEVLDQSLLDSSFREDLLLAPQDKTGPEVDEDDMIYGKTGEDASRDAGSKLDHLRHPDDYEDIDSENFPVGHTPWSKKSDLPVKENGPDDDYKDEFAHDEDAMVDLGDDDNYYDDDFDSMMRDPGNMYEMNRLRKLAGLEQIAEKKADKDDVNETKHYIDCPDCDGTGKDLKADTSGPQPIVGDCPRCGGFGKIYMDKVEEKKADKDYDGDGKIESAEDEYKGSKDKAIKKAKMEEDIFDDNAEKLAAGELIPYEVDDEKAYYMMADILGAELDFGPEDEILVPAAREDEVVLGLENEGFEQGKDFWRADARYEAELQNGYNDRAFSKGDDYFPKGAQSTPASDLGPSASGMADNPMSNKMRMIKKDSVYETMKLAYRRFRRP